MNEDPMRYKMFEPLRIASVKKVIASRDELPAVVEAVTAACGAAACGDAMTIFYGGAVKDGIMVEVGMPVSGNIEAPGVHTRTLAGGPVLTTLHHGPRQGIRDTVRRIVDFLEQRAWGVTGVRYEIYLKTVADRPENDLTETVVPLHQWECLLAQGAQKVMGENVSRQLIEGAQDFSLETSIQQGTQWICSAMQRLDALTGDEQAKCRIVSSCAHVFPQDRIDHLRSIYERGEFDDVLREMYTDFFWYGDPDRVGNVLYIKKRPPFDEEGYRKATSDAERRKANCHCKFVRPFLDQVSGQLSPTFCYCGVGWYIRLWEGVLGKPVKVGNMRSLLHGDGECSLTLTLPIELNGECHPPLKRKYSDDTQ
jgi:effector-binding domain-containing protein